MNIYYKYVANTFLAKCTDKHEKGETIILSTKHGKEHECIVFNLIFEKDGFYYYSIVRSDGFNFQEFCKRKAERYNAWSNSAEKKANDFYKKSHSIVENIPLGQPILVGHHSEARHRRDLDNSWRAMGKSVEMTEKANQHESKAEYWERKASQINLSMPESVEYYEYKLEVAKSIHQGMKNGTVERRHSYSLTYAKKAVNEAATNLEIAKKLWQ